jgi:hypothetical protein
LLKLREKYLKIFSFPWTKDFTLRYYVVRKKKRQSRLAFTVFGVNQGGQKT